MKKLIIILFVLTGASLLVADPQVTDVVAKQRYPWNGMVDITCKVSGIDGTTNGLYFSVAAVNQDSGSTNRLSHWVVQNGKNSTARDVCTNGNYRLLWDAHATFGEVIYSNIVLSVTTVDDAHNKVQLWEGGPYWADTNIGANEPEEYGYYFWWGDTIGYKRENDKWVATDGSSWDFSFGSATPTYDHYISNATLQSEGWITANSVLAPAHDAAHVHWGGKWRMPTFQELEDLNSKCDWTWTTQNGVNGCVVKGKGAYASASIFLPASGHGDGTSLFYAGSFGYYRSSVPHSDDGESWSLDFGSGHHFTGCYIYGRIYGFSVRPVQGFTE